MFQEIRNMDHNLYTGEHKQKTLEVKNSKILLEALLEVFNYVLELRKNIFILFMRFKTTFVACKDLFLYNALFKRIFYGIILHF